MKDVLIEAASILEGEAEALLTGPGMGEDMTADEKARREQMLRVAEALREIVRTTA